MGYFQIITYKISPNELFDFDADFKKNDTFILNGGIGNSQSKSVNNSSNDALIHQLEEKDRQINKLLELLAK